MEGVGGVDADHAGPPVRLEHLKTRQIVSPEVEHAMSGYELLCERDKLNQTDFFPPPWNRKARGVEVLVF